MYYNIIISLFNCDSILFSGSLFILFVMGCTLIHDLKLQNILLIFLCIITLSILLNYFIFSYYYQYYLIIIDNMFVSGK